MLQTARLIIEETKADTAIAKVVEVTYTREDRTQIPLLIIYTNYNNLTKPDSPNLPKP